MDLLQFLTEAPFKRNVLQPINEVPFQRHVLQPINNPTAITNKTDDFHYPSHVYGTGKFLNKSISVPQMPIKGILKRKSKNGIGNVYDNAGNKGHVTGSDASLAGIMVPKMHSPVKKIAKTKLDRNEVQLNREFGKHHRHTMRDIERKQKLARQQVHELTKHKITTKLTHLNTNLKTYMNTNMNTSMSMKTLSNRWIDPIDPKPLLKSWNHYNKYHEYNENLMSDDDIHHNEHPTSNVPRSTVTSMLEHGYILYIYLYNVPYSTQTTSFPRDHVSFDDDDTVQQQQQQQSQEQQQQQQSQEQQQQQSRHVQTSLNKRKQSTSKQQKRQKKDDRLMMKVVALQQELHESKVKCKAYEDKILRYAKAWNKNDGHQKWKKRQVIDEKAVIERKVRQSNDVDGNSDNNNNGDADIADDSGRSVNNGTDGDVKNNRDVGSALNFDYNLKELNSIDDIMADKVQYRVQSKLLSDLQSNNSSLKDAINTKTKYIESLKE